jgi:hypothetical protein
MKRPSRKFVRLAAVNVDIGLRLSETCLAYSKEVQLYKTSALTALAALLEALSGVLCELARQQGGDEPTLAFNRQSGGDASTLLRVNRFLKQCATILAAEHRGAKPFTALYLKAQTLTSEVRELAEMPAKARAASN